MLSDLKKKEKEIRQFLVWLFCLSISLHLCFCFCVPRHGCWFCQKWTKKPATTAAQLNKELKKWDCLSVDQSIHRVNSIQAVFCLEKVSIWFMISSVVLTWNAPIHVSSAYTISQNQSHSWCLSLVYQNHSHAWVLCTVNLNCSHSWFLCTVNQNHSHSWLLCICCQPELLPFMILLYILSTWFTLIHDSSLLSTWITPILIPLYIMSTWITPCQNSPESVSFMIPLYILSTRKTLNLISLYIVSTWITLIHDSSVYVVNQNHTHSDSSVYMINQNHSQSWFLCIYHQPESLAFVIPLYINLYIPLYISLNHPHSWYLSTVNQNRSHSWFLCIYSVSYTHLTLPTSGRV